VLKVQEAGQISYGCDQAGVMVSILATCLGSRRPDPIAQLDKEIEQQSEVELASQGASGSRLERVRFVYDDKRVLSVGEVLEVCEQQRVVGHDEAALGQDFPDQTRVLCRTCLCTAVIGRLRL
jgi:hypothetical protein